MPRIEIMTAKGDDLLAEWGCDTRGEDLAKISHEFGEMRAKGFSAFTVQSGRRVDDFDPDIEEDIIVIAPLVGG